MSNAAVIKLQRKSISGNSVWLDDNFGESIHLHINDFRVDMTCRAFEQMTKDALETIDTIVNVEGFHAADYDPVFLEQMLWKRLLYLTRVKKETLHLSELWVNEPRLRRVEKSRMYKNVVNETSKVRSKGSDHFGQSGRERLKTISSSISERGYDEDLGCFVVYGDDNVIRDGQHRACILMHQQGDVEVPVIRLYFSNYKDVDSRKRSAPFGILYHCVWRFREFRKETKIFSKNTLKSLLKGGYFVTKSRHRSGRFAMPAKKKKELTGIFAK